MAQSKRKSISRISRIEPRESMVERANDTYQKRKTHMRFFFCSFDVVVFLFFGYSFFLFILFLPILVFVCYMYFFLFSSSLFWMCLCICMLRSSYVCFFVRCFIFILVRIFLPFILIRIYELDYSMENKKRIRRNRREKNENSKAKDGRNEKRNLY